MDDGDGQQPEEVPCPEHTIGDQAESHSRPPPGGLHPRGRCRAVVEHAVDQGCVVVCAGTPSTSKRGRAVVKLNGSSAPPPLATRSAALSFFAQPYRRPPAHVRATSSDPLHFCIYGQPDGRGLSSLKPEPKTYFNSPPS